MKKKKDEGLGLKREQEFATFDDKLEVLRFSSSVHSPLKDEITPDFVLAKLDEKNRNFIIEMTSNAYFMKAIYDYMRLRLIQTKHKYDEQYFQNTLEILDKISADLFKTFMIKNNMIAALHRNVKDNHLLNQLTQSPIMEEPEQQLQTFQQKAIEKLRPNEIQ